MTTREPDGEQIEVDWMYARSRQRELRELRRLVDMVIDATEDPYRLIENQATLREFALRLKEAEGA